MPPAVTSPLGFPYPLGSDPVADGDNQIRALAEKVDDHLAYNNGLPATLTANAGWDSSAARVRRIGYSVHLTLSAAKATWAAGEVCCFVPAPYWPPSNVYFTVFHASSAAAHAAYVRPDGGVVVVLAATSQGGINGSASWAVPVGTALLLDRLEDDDDGAAKPGPEYDGGAGPFVGPHVTPNHDDDDD